MDHQSVCLFSLIRLFLIKFLLQLEYHSGHAQRKGAFFKFFEYGACTDSDSTGHKNAPKIVSLGQCLEQLYSGSFNSYVKVL